MQVVPLGSIPTGNGHGEQAVYLAISLPADIHAAHPTVHVIPDTPAAR